MREEGNKEMVRRWDEEAWGGNDRDVIDHVLAPDYTVNGEAIGAEGVERSVEWLQATFRYPHLTLEDLVAEEDKVVLRWGLHGEHTDAFLGVTPTGRTLEPRGINVYRLAGGRIVENHEVVDIHGLLEQLGTTPT
ncbi:MAG: ester cyclase [Chloroflexota bacterium]|nr:ester cyclase [Chloroflexota bacterium]